MTVSDSVLAVEDVSVRVADKYLLRDVGFQVCGGELMAILGPTGSGKTTLLNTIAGRMPLKSGRITLNGTTFRNGGFRKLGFAIQQDFFLQNLTLRDTLYFTAMMRLPESLPRKEKLGRMEEIVDILELRSCLGTDMGGIFHKGLSGGEKKRASIACELLADADILLTDEPTSGLDSFMSLTVMNQLKKLTTEQKKTVIVTIHQPSSQIYQLFDKLLLLDCGQAVYCGPAKDSPLLHFEQFGLFCQPHCNPADFMMEVLRSNPNVLQGRPADSRTTTIRLENVAGNIALRSLDTFDGGPTNNQAFDSTENGSRDCMAARERSLGVIVELDNMTTTNTKERISKQTWPTSAWTQFRLLVWRKFKNSRAVILDLYSIIEVLGISLVIGMIYFRIPQEPDTMRDRLSLIAVQLLFWTYKTSLDGLSTYLTEYDVLCKEMATRVYRLPAYYFASMASELPLLLCLPSISYAITYWMSGISGAREFFITWPMLFLHVHTSQGIGVLAIAVGRTLKRGVCILSITAFSSVVLAGIFTRTLPWWLEQVKYLSFFLYPTSVINMVIFSNMANIPCNETRLQDYPRCTGNSTDYITSDDVLHKAGITLPLHCYLATSVIICCLVRVAGYYAMKWRIQIPK